MYEKQNNKKESRREKFKKGEHSLWFVNRCLRLSYNTHTRSMRGSSMCYAISVSNLLIVFLSLSTLGLGIYYRETRIDLRKSHSHIYDILFVIHALSTLLTIQRLFRCAKTDPGFIPSPKLMNNTVLSHRQLSRLRDDS